MFNYVVKDPDSSRLSGEFWIKDANGLGRICVSSNLVALSSRWKRLPEIARSGPNSTRLHLTQRRLTFSTNFLRLSNFASRVNIFRSLPFRERHTESPNRRANKKSSLVQSKNIRTALLPRSTQLLIRSAATKRPDEKRRSGPTTSPTSLQLKLQ